MQSETRERAGLAGRAVDWARREMRAGARPSAAADRRVHGAGARSSVDRRLERADEKLNGPHAPRSEGGARWRASHRLARVSIDERHRTRGAAPADPPGAGELPLLQVACSG